MDGVDAPQVISFVRGIKDLSVSRTVFLGHSRARRRKARGVCVAGTRWPLHYASLRFGRRREVQKFWPADLHLIARRLAASTACTGRVLDGRRHSRAALVRPTAGCSSTREDVEIARQYCARETVHAVLGTDALRYFLLREIPFGRMEFFFDALVQRYNETRQRLRQPGEPRG